MDNGTLPLRTTKATNTADKLQKEKYRNFSNHWKELDGTIMIGSLTADIVYKHLLSP